MKKKLIQNYCLLYDFFFFLSAGIKTIEQLASQDARRIELIVGRRAPFGDQLLQSCKNIAKMNIDIKQVNENS